MIPQKNPLIASGESVHANMLTTLWENPSPTSNFVAQDITLASDDYDFLLWIYGTASTNPKGSVIAPKGTGSILLSSGLTNSTHGVTNVQRTAVYVSDTKYSVSAGTLGRPSGAYSEDNTVCKPIAVYGFKKSLDITAIVSNVSTDARQCMLSDGVTDVESVVEKTSYFSGITPQTGYTLTDGYAYVINGVKYAHLRFNLGSGITARTKIATVPSELKPSILPIRYVAAAASTYNNQLDKTVTGYLQTNGDLYAGDNLGGTTIKEVDVLLTYM